MESERRRLRDHSYARDLVMDPFAGFLLGIAGALHCAGMCGPIAMALPTQSTTSTMSFVVGRILYQFGRITSYMVLGACAAFGAGALSLAGAESVVSIVAGGLMIVTAVMQILWHKSILPSNIVFRLTQPVRAVMSHLMKRKSHHMLFVIGVANGFLPCGLVLSAIFGSASTNDVVDGAIFMLGFGFGTMPVMSAIALGSGSFIKQIVNRHKLVLPLIALFLGATIIVRGMHLGIPYVSPKPPVSNSNAECCSKH